MHAMKPLISTTATFSHFLVEKVQWQLEAFPWNVLNTYCYSSVIANTERRDAVTPWKEVAVWDGTCSGPVILRTGKQDQVCCHIVWYCPSFWWSEFSSWSESSCMAAVAVLAVCAGQVNRASLQICRWVSPSMSLSTVISLLISLHSTTKSCICSSLSLFWATIKSCPILNSLIDDINKNPPRCNSMQISIYRKILQ